MAFAHINRLPNRMIFSHLHWGYECLHRRCRRFDPFCPHQTFRLFFNRLYRGRVIGKAGFRVAFTKAWRVLRSG